MVDWRDRDVPREVSLPPQGHLPAHRHLFSERSVWALRAALGARRPLLVRGEPGTGKSELARAAAHVWQRPLVSEVITARTEPADLHWRFDAVARLGEAQLLAVGAPEGAASAAEQRAVRIAALEEARFLQPGPLWWVFDWAGAEQQHERAAVKGARQARPKDWKPERGTVLLIDEIDKADADLPNGLLESLGNGAFHVPYLPKPVCCDPEHAPPLVVITTNEERELPAAFVRRCLVLQLSLPKGQELVGYLMTYGQAHFDARCTKRVYRKAAELLVDERRQAEAGGLVKPGLAEYLDLLRATLELGQRPLPPEQTEEARQLGVLEKVAGFALAKNPAAP